MPATEPSLSIDELGRLLQAADPGALLVPARILRRLIKADRHTPGIALQVPHRAGYVVSRERLFELTDRTELLLAADRELPDTLVLLNQPRAAVFADTPRDAVLLRTWRRLFHGRVHIAVRQRNLDDAALRQRIDRIGPLAWDEICAVLRQEGLLLPPADDRAAYEEFAAFYLELRHFAAPLVPVYFPGLRHAEGIEPLLAQDVDAAQLFAATRLPGAAEPALQRVAEALTGDADDEDEPTPTPTREPPSRGRFQHLRERAERAAQRGNLVRAAILHMRAADAAPSGYASQAETAARADLQRLGSRLQRALELSTAEAKPLRRLLPTLLAPAAAGIWPVEARLLYDLQRVCIDHERAVYRIDLAGWVLSMGGRPLKRPLPGQEHVRTLKHLHVALRRLAAARIAEAPRRQLADLLQQAVVRTEGRVRDHYRPLIQQTLDEVGLRPENLPERVARHKLTEELLDRACARGFLTIGDLRDALSRNQLKLPDLAGPVEWLAGDPLLRTDRAFQRRLDGTYHGGEVYMRWLQRLSALTFGTPLGRWLTLYLLLPFGCAFMILAGTEALVHEGEKVLHLFEPKPAVEVPPPPEPTPELPSINEDDLSIRLPEKDGKSRHSMFLNLYTLAALGIFLGLVINVPSFRQAVWHALRLTWHALHRVFVDWPQALAQLPAVKAFLASRLWWLVKQFALKPALLAAPFALIVPLSGAGHESSALGAAVCFVAALIVLNTRVGRDVEELFVDRSARLWEHVRSDFLPGLFHLILAVFKQFVEGIERILYTVDEWLRFRTGDSRLSLTVKAVLGLVWYVVTYFVRVIINLFVEPTFNPIKHFPVVTVAAKLLVPAIPWILETSNATLAPVLGFYAAGSIGGMAIFFLPGLAGFLVWEFKENWRLYRANRSATLRPILVGSHGETVRRLLRPGIHSGTVPKLYAKLRRAARAGERTDQWQGFHKQRAALHHVEEAVHHFVERELVHLLEECGCGAAPQVGAIELASNCIRIELKHETGSAAHILLAEQGGWLWAELAEPGWLATLTGTERDALNAALAGFYTLSGVDLVRTQVLRRLGLGPCLLRTTVNSLVVRCGKDYDNEVIYLLNDSETLDATTPGAPPLPAVDVLFDRQPIAWSDWVATWEQLRAGKAQQMPASVLPP